jgi:hypothetical protein
MVRTLSAICLIVLFAGLPEAAGAQTQQTPPVPKPFPQPGQPASPAAPVVQAPAKPSPPAPTGTPTEATLGVAIYPNAEFITSYDAGQGQRYYLFGTNAPFPTVVTYYKNVLKDKGELVFEEPPVQEFDIGKFKEDTMAFPPSVTVKDYTWGGMEGYLNPKPGAQPERFKTIIQIVPVLAAAPTQVRK